MIISNLVNIAQSISELRNEYGTGHGKEASTIQLNSKHARLTLGAVSTLIIYLWETYKEQEKVGTKPE